MKTRTTLVLDEIVVEKLRQLSKGNISKLVNEILEKEFFKKKSMFGSLRGRISAKDIVKERDIHEELYR